MAYLIGIDIGTSATKTILMDDMGKILSSKTCHYSMSQPNNGWAEQNPLDWKNAVLTTLKAVVHDSGVHKDDIRGIGLSGQMHGLVMLDADYEIIRPPIIWCDQRTSAQVEKMEEILPVYRWLEITANPPLAAWTAAKILWVKENEPENYNRCKHILLPKDYIRFILTGELATDVSDASGMQILNVKERNWSDEILNLLHIDRSWLGMLYESQQATGKLLSGISCECGLNPNTVVAAGASDNACAAIGTGVIREGQAFTTIGTSAVMYTHLDQYKEIPKGRLHVCCCAVPGGWHTMGGPQSAGLSLEWFKDNFCHDYVQEAANTGVNVFRLIDQRVAEIPPGSDKLLYLPFLMGERTPNFNPDYRGAFIGLNAVHKSANLLRAIMEGVAYSLADCNAVLKSINVHVNSIRVCGGGGRSRIWRQILANLYGCDIRTLKQTEGPALGAAILAGVAAGVYEDIGQACDNLITEDEIVSVNQSEVEIYRQFHQLYDKVYTSLIDSYHALAAIGL